MKWSTKAGQSNLIIACDGMDVLAIPWDDVPPLASGMMGRAMAYSLAKAVDTAEGSEAELPQWLKQLGTMMQHPAED
jgi:hypothetical protein